VQHGGFAAVAALQDGLAAPKLVQKGLHTYTMCGKTSETY
jgi:hypothetical protein